MPQYLNLSDIKTIQIEGASLCNLACPQCMRIYKGKVNPYLPMDELQPEDYDKIFYKENLPQLTEVIFNGNYGDPAASKHLDYALRILQEKRIKTKIFTNGSLRSRLWWAELGKLFSKTGSYVVFSIDGLRDTNPIYRVNSRWDKIMDNAQAYIKAGGRARWDFLIFKHNEHQLESAKALAEEMGFKGFLEKTTTRFVNFTTHKKEASSEIFSRKGEGTGKIESSSKERKDFEELVERWGSFKAHLDNAPIHCKYKNDLQGVYIDFEARLWPCCWLGSPLYSPDSNHPGKKQLNLLFKRYGMEFNSLRYYSLSEILNHEWFESKLVESWKNKTTDENSRFILCGRTCGRGYTSTSGPGYKNSKMTRFY